MSTSCEQQAILEAELFLGLTVLMMQDLQLGPLGQCHLPQTVVQNILVHWPIVGGEKSNNLLYFKFNPLTECSKWFRMAVCRIGGEVALDTFSNKSSGQRLKFVFSYKVWCCKRENNGS